MSTVSDWVSAYIDESWERERARARVFSAAYTWFSFYLPTLRMVFRAAIDAVFSLSSTDNNHISLIILTLCDIFLRNLDLV